MARDSLEHDNFTPAELVEVARDLAANPREGREPARLELTAGHLLEHHADRRARVGRNKPAIADTLLSMARRPEHGHVTLSKSELAEGLARHLVSEVLGAEGTEALEEVKHRRPIVRFVLDRICPVLNRPRPIS